METATKLESIWMPEAGSGGSGSSNLYVNYRDLSSVCGITITWDNSVDIGYYSPVSDRFEELEARLEERIKCPSYCVNCGAPLKPSDTQCEYCNTYYK